MPVRIEHETTVGAAVSVVVGEANRAECGMDSTARPGTGLSAAVGTAHDACPGSPILVRAPVSDEVNAGMAFGVAVGGADTERVGCSILAAVGGAFTVRGQGSENYPPVVSAIPNQTIPEGTDFATINLDDYVTDVQDPDADIVWQASGYMELEVDITDRIATVSVPNYDWYGQETIRFKATDTGGLTDSVDVVFTVTSVNDPPVVTDIPDQEVAEGTPFATINLDDYVSDVEDPDADIDWTHSGEMELIVAIVDRVATITVPDENWTGSETITFKATDTDFLWDSDSATFTVTPVNDPPVVGDIPNQTIDQGESFATINLDDYVSDVEDPDEDIDWTKSGNVELTVEIVDRVATITTPGPSWYGEETVTFRATDTDFLYDEDDATFTVTAAAFDNISGVIADDEMDLSNDTSVNCKVMLRCRILGAGEPYQWTESIWSTYSNKHESNLSGLLSSTDYHVEIRLWLAGGITDWENFEDGILGPVFQTQELGYDPYEVP